MKVWYVNNYYRQPCADYGRAMRLALDEAKARLKYVSEHGNKELTYSIEIVGDVVEVRNNTGFAGETFTVWECEVLE